MCNVSVNDDINTIPQPDLLGPAGPAWPADLCQCWWGGVLCLLSQSFISPHCLGNSSLGSVRVWIHHPPLTATVTLPLPATDTVHP
ncbi:unnamed protein product [Staurois parvus]|uniref:Uncharacterized protein n=1 Tax=Staurois parvus TaxID=386267 RepID=A0ABN9ANK3_9NEOB|nr:unnamed protein product [Staurois parvus]